MVAAGILLSRIIGLVRNRVFAHYFGTSDAADAFNAAFRIPNFLQNLFGEGVLSASFIPVYAGLRARGDEARGAAGSRRRSAPLLGLAIVGAGAGRGPAHAMAHRRHRAGLRRARSASSPSDWCGSCFPARACWCCPPGASASSTAIAGSSSRYAAPVLWNLAIIAQL